MWNIPFTFGFTTSLLFVAFVQLYAELALEARVFPESIMA